MGSIIEHIKTVRGNSKSSTNKTDVKDISDELLVHWNGPLVTQCNSIVTQALNVHFNGGQWHFKTHDVRAKIHKVSAVVDRLNTNKSALSFMAK